MTARSIRRALERQQRKLTQKAERTALQNRDCQGAPAAPFSHINPELDEAASFSAPKTQLIDEFTPEFIAEANAVRDRVWRKAGLLPSEVQRPPANRTADSEPRPSGSGSSPAQLHSEPRATASGGVSPAQLSANRQNAQLSCGPRTAQGKQTVSFNAFRHGLAGRFKIMPYESEQDYEQLLDGLREEHRPSTPTENLLVDRMAQPIGFRSALSISRASVSTKWAAPTTTLTWRCICGTRPPTSARSIDV